MFEYKGFQITEPVNESQAVPLLMLMTLVEINEKLDKIIGEPEMAPLSLSTDYEEAVKAVEEETKQLTAMTREELESACKDAGIKFTKNMKDSTLIKRLEG